MIRAPCLALITLLLAGPAVAGPATKRPGSVGRGRPPATPEAVRMEEKRLESATRRFEVSAKKARLLKNQIQELTEERRSNEDLKTQLERELGTLDRKLLEGQQETRELETGLDGARQRFNRHLTAFSRRLLWMYEMRSLPTLGFVLEARSFAEFLRRHEYQKALSRHDLARIEELEVMRGEMESRQTVLAGELERARELRETRSRKNLELTRALARGEEIRRSLENELGQAEGDAREWKLKKTAIERRLEELRLDREERLTRRSGAGSGSGDPLDRALRPGTFGWPIDGDIEVLRSFRTPGTAGSPDAGNPGIDIAIRKLTNVRAAEAGQVLHAGELPAFGKVLMIDHGGHPEHVITVYGNLDSLLATMGQWVQRGDPVALTGGSGDPRTLHFEVRKDAAPQDPLVWLER